MKLTHQLSNPLFSVPIALGLTAFSTATYADSNFYMTGRYQVTLSSGGSRLNCRLSPSINASVVHTFSKGEKIMVTDVAGHSNPWLKTSEDCYIRGHANYLKKMGLPTPEESSDETLPEMLPHDDDFDGNYYMTGTYLVSLSSGGQTLNCRDKPTMNAEIQQKFYKNEKIKVVDVKGHSSPWLKTSDRCYVRGHENFVTILKKPTP